MIIGVAARFMMKNSSCKINDDLGNYYCFGCGAKGDIFTIYIELYNYSFPDAVKELAQRAGIKLTENNPIINKQNQIIFNILEDSLKWFENNLNNDIRSKNYLENRNISKNTIKHFKIGSSFNSQSSLYEHLKSLNYNDSDLLKSNVVKVDNNNNIRDFFYKRIIFPIFNEQNKIVGFGGRVLDNTNPKYINSPETYFFQKRNILYNLNLAKDSIRSKKNILICEGYMDVISLYEKNIKTAVAPLGTALTELQLMLSWKYVNKPTIMFDGDEAGLRASYKSALLALEFLTPNKYVQFIRLPKNFDPDSYINKHSLASFTQLLKKPIPIVNFIFDQSVSTIDLKIADNKISFDKYIDDIVEKIKDKKIKYLYKNDFKSLFFNFIKNQNTNKYSEKKSTTVQPLIKKQIDSFLAAYLNHISVRKEITSLLKSSDLLNNDQMEFIDFFENSDHRFTEVEKMTSNVVPAKMLKKLENIMENCNFDLFLTQKRNMSQKTLLEIKESIENLNTRLLNLKKINKSLDEFESNSSSLTWEELKKLSSDLHVIKDEYFE